MRGEVTVTIRADGVEGEREVCIEYKVKSDGNIDILTCDGCVLCRAAQQEIERINEQKNFWKRAAFEELEGNYAKE